MGQLKDRLQSDLTAAMKAQDELTRATLRMVLTAIGNEEDSHLGDFIEDKSAILPVDAAIQSNLRETTTRVLASLPKGPPAGTPVDAVETDASTPA